MSPGNLSCLTITSSEVCSRALSFTHTNPHKTAHNHAVALEISHLPADSNCALAAVVPPKTSSELCFYLRGLKSPDSKLTREHTADSSRHAASVSAQKGSLWLTLSLYKLVQNVFVCKSLTYYREQDVQVFEDLNS